MEKSFFMENKDRLKILSQFDNDFILEVIKKANQNDITIYSSKVKEVWNDIINGSAKIEVLDVDWYYHYQIELFNVDSNDQTVCFAMRCKIKFKSPATVTTTGNKSGREIKIKPNGSLYAIFTGAIDFYELTDERVEIAPSMVPILIANATFNDKKTIIENEWERLSEKLRVAKLFSSIDDRNEFLMKKIDALTEMEEMELLDDKGFMDRMTALLTLTKHKKSRVWGEYDVVNNITSEPVLMNKATAIALTKEQVVGLVNNLSELYALQLKALRSQSARAKLSANKGRVPVRFSYTMGAHANPDSFEIVLPKVGDWRMGYNGLYCAETVFHEFAHVIDFGKHYGTNIVAHRHDFVNILDNMLVKFKDWIDKMYSFEYHEKQIRENSDKILVFYSNKKNIVSQIAKEEKATREAQAKIKSKKQSELGISENEYPLSLILKQEDKVQLDYLIWVFNKYSQGTLPKSDLDKARVLSKKIKSASSVLTKDETKLLFRVIKEGNRSEYTFSLPMIEQMKAMDIIKEFEKTVEKFSKGEIKSMGEKDDSYKIDEYDQNMILPDDDERMKILRIKNN